MSNRIQNSNLDAICDHINKAMERAKTPYRYSVGGSYGRTNLYKGTIEKSCTGEEYLGQNESVYSGTKSDCYEILHAIFRGANEVLNAKESRAIVKRQKENDKIRNKAIEAERKARAKQYEKK